MTFPISKSLLLTIVACTAVAGIGSASFVVAIGGRSEIIELGERIAADVERIRMDVGLLAREVGEREARREEARAARMNSLRNFDIHREP